MIYLESYSAGGCGNLSHSSSERKIKQESQVAAGSKRNDPSDKIIAFTFSQSFLASFHFPTECSQTVGAMVK